MNRTTAIRLANLEGLIAPETGERLYELAREVPSNLAIVEIGSFKGKSSCYLGRGSLDGFGAKVHCIEPWDLDGNITGKHNFTDPLVRETWEAQVASETLLGLVTPHQAFSYEFVHEWRETMGEGSIGMLFIDGSHEYQDVKRDFLDWAELVVPDGVIVFDDYSERNRGVMRYVDELRRVPFYFDFDTPPLAIVRLHASS